ncbi:MAG: alanine racemase, partial [Oscillospiraceae bacterium]|nr:alanine racemase [Oscillospiraceae bacterium]
MQTLRRTWAEVNLDAVAHNFGEIRKAAAIARVMAIVKADAYGHGAVPVARLLRDAGADYLGVASVDEAMELRRAGLKLPVLILGFTPPAFVPL